MRHISGFRLFLLAALTATSLIAERAGDAIAGSIVVGDDVNTFGTILAGSNEAKFAVNVANFLTAGHATKNLLLFEATPGDGTRDFSPVILNALTGAGFSVTVTTNYTMSFTGFDAVFTEQKFPAVTFLDNSALINYVNGGGGVYIVGGVGNVAPTEAAGWATFLNNFGLGLEPAYHGFTNIPITSANPLFSGVTSLNVGNGQSIVDLGTDPNAQIIQTFLGQNVFAEVTGTQVVPAPSIGRGLPALFAMGGVLLGAKLSQRRKKLGRQFGRRVATIRNRISRNPATNRFRPNS